MRRTSIVRGNRHPAGRFRKDLGVRNGDCMKQWKREGKGRDAHIVQQMTRPASCEISAVA